MTRILIVRFLKGKYFFEHLFPKAGATAKRILTNSSLCNAGVSHSVLSIFLGIAQRRDAFLRGHPLF